MGQLLAKKWPNLHDPGPMLWFVNKYFRQCFGKIDHNMDFWEKKFRREWVKLAKNADNVFPCAHSVKLKVIWKVIL
jgi:hypothetical protein